MERKRTKYIDADGQRLKMGERYLWPIGDFVDEGVVRWEPRYGHVFAPDRYAGTSQVFSIPFNLVSATSYNRKVWQCELHHKDRTLTQPQKSSGV